MKGIKVTLFGLCAVGLATLTLAQPATYDKRTMFTFSGPVELPGVGLQAGEYVFKLADPDGSRQVYQVTSADGRKAYGMFFGLPIEASEIPSKPEVRFMETAAGAPSPIRAFWYPGIRTGFEFIYPRQQAQRIAARAKEPVLTTVKDSTTAAETNTADLTRLSSSGQETPQTIARNEPSAPVGTAGSAARQNDDRATTAHRAELPRTASNEPLIAMVGLGLIGLGLAARVWRRNSVRT